MNTPEQGQSKHNKKKMDQVKDRALGQVRHKDRALAVLEIPHGSSQGPGPWAKVGHKDRALAGLEFFPAVRLLPQKADCQETKNHQIAFMCSVVSYHSCQCQPSAAQELG